VPRKKRREGGRDMTREKLADRKLPDYTKGEEIMNMVTHILGSAAGIVSLTLGAVIAVWFGDGYSIAGALVYGISMILLYTFSSVYHGLGANLLAKKVMQVIDHCSIFILIAGTYTPIVLCSIRAFDPLLGWTLFGVVWAAAVVGIVLNSIDIRRYKKFSAVCYLAMGWCIVFAYRALDFLIARGGTGLLLAGGLCYTVGAFIYYFFKKTRYMHSVFHIFVLAGSINHMLYILLYVLR